MSDIIQCPFCAEDIKAAAKKCKHCGEWLEERSIANPERLDDAVKIGSIEKEPSSPASSQERIQCKFCEGDIPADALKCQHCGHLLKDTAVTEGKRFSDGELVAVEHSVFGPNCMGCAGIMTAIALCGVFMSADAAERSSAIVLLFLSIVGVALSAQKGKSYKIEGLCPYCEEGISFDRISIDQKPVKAVDCSVCAKRIVVKGLKLYRV